MDDARKIENLIYRYAELIDSGNLEELAELFAAAEIVSPAHGTSISGCEDVLALYQSSCRLYASNGTPLTKHLTTNVIIEVAEDGQSANARAYYTVIQATDALPLQPIISGRYADKFAKDNDNWHFVRREMYVDLLGDCSAHLLYDASSL